MPVAAVRVRRDDDDVGQRDAGLFPGPPARLTGTLRREGTHIADDHRRLREFPCRKTTHRALSGPALRSTGGVMSTIAMPASNGSSASEASPGRNTTASKTNR